MLKDVVNGLNTGHSHSSSLYGNGRIEIGSIVIKLKRTEPRTFENGYDQRRTELNLRDFLMKLELR